MHLEKNFAATEPMGVFAKKFEWDFDHLDRPRSAQSSHVSL
jgi:hypothetical protein